MKNPSISFKSRRALPSLIQYSAALGLIVAGSTTAQAIEFYKANNTTSLNQSASWEDLAGVPFVDPIKPINGTGQPDILIWDSRVTAANTVEMGGDIGLNTIRIGDTGGLTPGAGPIVINSTSSNRTFTFTANGGVDMSLATQDLTLSSGIFFRATGGVVLNQNVAAGRVLTINGPANVRNSSSGGTTNHPGAGKVIYNGTFAPSNLNVGNGEVQLNAPGGSTRHGTNTTTINGGKLVINNTSGSATGSGAVNVNNTGTLSGQGIMNGLVTINSGGIMAPGANGIGKLQAGSLALAAGSTINWEGIDPLQADIVNVTGENGLTINGGTFNLYNVGTTDPFTGTGIFNLFQYTGAINGGGISSLAVAESSKIEGNTYSFGLAGGFVTLTIFVDNRPKAFWNVDSNSNWSNGANWTGLVSPNAQTFVANLGGAGGTPITAPRTVTLDAPRTVGTLNFDSVEPFTVTGTSVLTFDDGAAAATIFVANGSHVISTPLSLPSEGIISSITNSGSTLTLGGEILGDGGISKSGAGTLILGADNFYFGATTNGSGVLQLGTGGATGSVNGPIANSGTLRINRSDNFIFVYPISGTGGVDFAGSGTTYLGVANTFSGPTTISAGAIELGDGQALQNSTLTYSSTGGPLVISEFVSTVTLGALAGDRSFPLTNSIGVPMSLTVGQNNATTSYTASTTGTGDAFTKAGSGTFTLTGTHAFTGNTTINGGVLSLDTGSDFSTAAANTTVAGSKILVNGGTLTSSASSLLPNASAGLQVAAGTANFNGGIASENNPSAGAFFVNVTGGILNAASISIPRGNLNLGTNEPTAGSATAGLYINGGAVNISGTLGIGKSATNSTANTRMDSGSLTVDGATTVTINSPDRWSVLDIAGGTFTSTDATAGVLLGGTTSGRVAMLVRGASTVATAERFQFGQPDLAGSSILNLTAGSLYVGGGGMVLGSANPGLTARLKLGGGVLGATADSSSTVPVSLTGPAVVTGADALDVPHTVTFSGNVDGTGTLTKNGSGSVSFTSQGNSFTGAVTVNTGTLGLGGQTGAVTVTSTGALTPRGTLTTQAATTIDGTLAISYDADNQFEPGHLHSQGTLTLGAGSALVISGTGTLTGPVYFLASGATGINGTFDTISPVPSGYTLDTNFNNGSGFPIIALVSDTASPYDLWASGFGLAGAAAGANADPDNDGVRNLIEYGLGTNPTQFSAGPVLGNSGGFLTLTFDHIAGGGITFAIEANDSLDDTWDVVQTYPTFGSAGTTVFTDNVAVGTGNSRFIRLAVIKN